MADKTAKYRTEIQQVCQQREIIFILPLIIDFITWRLLQPTTAVSIMREIDSERPAHASIFWSFVSRRN
jgi:hypothetical protein